MSDKTLEQRIMEAADSLAALWFNAGRRIPKAMGRAKAARATLAALVAEACAKAPPGLFDNYPLADRLRILERAWRDEVEDDTAIRELARPVLGDWVDGDSFEVPPKVRIVERLVAKVCTLPPERVCRWARVGNFYEPGCTGHSGRIAFMFGDYCHDCGWRIELAKEAGEAEVVGNE